MIPCTSISSDCGDFNISSKCIGWGGTTISCLSLTAGQPLEDVITSVGELACEAVNSLSSFPTAFDWQCLTAPATTTFTDGMNTIVTELCSLETNKVSNSVADSLSFGCVTSTTGLFNILQNIVNSVNSQKVIYNTSHFTTTNPLTCATREVAITTPTWVSYTPNVFSDTPNNVVSNSTAARCFYLKDILGNVRVSGTFTMLSTSVQQTDVSAVTSTGYYLPFLEVPSAIQVSALTLASGHTILCYVDCYVGAEYDTSFADSFGNRTNGIIASTFTYNTVTPANSTVTSLETNTRILIPCAIISWNGSQYFSIDKAFLPKGVNAATANLVGTNSVRIYMNTITYNIN